MIDLSSLDALTKSLPRVPRDLEGILMMKTRRADAVSPATASLAQRGYIGCVPFAHIQKDEVVLRLQPGRSLKEARVAVAWGDFTEGLTISPDLEHFVGCRLAQLDAANPALPIGEPERKKLLKFAASFGSTESVERVLDAIPEASALEDGQARSGKLWRAADPDEPLCQVLEGAWTYSGDELGNWVDQAIRRFPEEPIVWRLYVAHHVNNDTGVDISDVAWKLVMSDTVFDANYNGTIPGPTLSGWESAPLIQAAQWLEARKPRGLDRRKSLSLEAARAFAADPESYSGVPHLEAARALVGEDPVLAYTHAANAAVFYVRAKDRTPAASIVLCHDLAKAQGWTELQQVLDWTVAELKT
jgi:hypothetical protein